MYIFRMSSGTPVLFLYAKTHRKGKVSNIPMHNIQLIVHMTATQQYVAIIINNVTIQRVQATTFLGVLIDESLNWKNHINMLKSKLSKVASVI